MVRFALFCARLSCWTSVVGQNGKRDPQVAERFEVYFKGVELANGFHELTDPKEQRVRFEQDNTKRIADGLCERQCDERLLAALAHGLPDCAGVALGIDRLMLPQH